MIILAVNIRCKKEKLKEAKSFFASFVSRARAEEGCVQYELLQSKDDPQIFYFFEKWANQQTYETHSRQLILPRFSGHET